MAAAPLVYRKTDLPTVVGLSARHVSRLEAENQFPRRIRLGARAVGWLADEVHQWLRDRERVARE